MKPTTTRVIVANGETARLFELRGRNMPLVPVEGHVWTAPDLNAFADGPGMTHSRVGPSQHRLDPRASLEDRAIEGFAREICDRLAASLQRGEFERLVIAAAPRLMGALRQHLSAALRATVWMEIDKDFTGLPLEKLDGALDAHLYT